MCGRYDFSVEQDAEELRETICELGERYKDEPEKLAAMGKGEIFPTHVVPVLARGRGADGMAAGLMTWGIPRWNGSGVMINSRVETIMTALEKSKPTTFLNRRCIVPSTGYFEWAHVDGQKKKEKYLLRLPGQPMLYMAGTWDHCTDKAGNRYLGFVVLTTAATGPVATIHDRMPVILFAEERRQWLHDVDAAKEILARPGPELVMEKIE